jgi:hypothetical protein
MRQMTGTFGGEHGSVETACGRTHSTWDSIASPIPHLTDEERMHDTRSISSTTRRLMDPQPPVCTLVSSACRLTILDEFTRSAHR